MNMNTRHQQTGAIRGKWWLILLLLIGAGVWYYFRQTSSSKNPADVFITLPVTRGTIKYTINASGTIKPYKQVDVGAQVSGKIAKLYVKIGDTVSAGMPIAEIDARAEENSKQTAIAQLTAQQATLATARANLTRAQQNYNRKNTLVKKGAAPREELESALNTLENAQSAVKEAEASIRQSELTIENANIDLEHTKVTAPISGTVISVAVEEGQTVTAIQTIPKLITLAQTDKMTVKAEIAEADVNAVSPGMPVSFSLLGRDKTIYTGVLKHVDPAPTTVSDNLPANAFGNQAVYYYGDIDIDNTDKKLRYGMTANVAIEVQKSENVLIIPMTALDIRPDGDTRVRVLINQKPISRRVKIGIDDGINAEVISGLKEGEVVIVSSLDGNTSPDSDENDAVDVNSDTDTEKPSATQKTQGDKS